jgi:hypothetical protein
MHGYLDMSRPASATTSLRFLQRAAELVGMLERPWTHNIRRGAAADIALLKDASRNTNNRAWRSINHSMASANHGVTDAYIGYDARDSWAERLTTQQQEQTTQPVAATTTT